MRKSPMQKFAITCIAACAVFGVVGTANAQMHGASHAGGGATTMVAPPTVAAGFTTAAGFITIEGSMAAACS